MSERIIENFVIPEGTTVLVLDGGIKVTLTENANVSIDREIAEHIVAELLVAAGKPEILAGLKGYYNQHGVKAKRPKPVKNEPPKGDKPEGDKPEGDKPEGTENGQ